MRLLLLALGATLLWCLLAHDDTAEGVVPGHVPTCGDYDLDGDVDIADFTSFLAPVRRLDTYPDPDGAGPLTAHPNWDAAWDRIPGPMVPGAQAWVTVQDMVDLLPIPRLCPDSIPFLSKLTDLDAQYNADPAATTAMMNAHYEAVMTFGIGCPICNTFGAAYTAGPVYVYLDPTALECSNTSCNSTCTGDQPGVTCQDVLRTTGGAVCWQRFWDNQRALADVTQADVRDDIVAYAQAQTHGDAIYIDVAEPYLPSATDCDSPAVSDAAWLAGWATLAERLQAEVIGPLLLNTQYPTWGDLLDTSQTDADRYWAAADVVEAEFGWAYGRHGEGTVSGAADKLAYYDHLHGLGTAVYTQDYPPDCPANPCGNADFPAQAETFGAAMFLITAQPGDYYGTFNHDGHGSAFAALYDRAMGDPLGPRTSCGSGCYQRVYERGTVQTNVVTKTGTVP